MSKGPDAFRTISEVAKALDLPQHVLRFWETRFAQIKPLKRGGGRRYYRPDDVDLLRGIRQLLYGEGFTIKGVQRILKEQGPRFVIDAGRGDVDGKATLSHRSAGGVGDDIVDDDALDAVDDYEVDDDDGAPDVEPPDVLPVAEPPERPAVAHLRVIEGSAPETRQARLSNEEAKVLRTALDELIECKRILDSVR